VIDPNRGFRSLADRASFPPVSLSPLNTAPEDRVGRGTCLSAGDDDVFLKRLSARWLAGIR